MEQALYLIAGFLGWLILLGIIGMILMLYTNKKEDSK